MSYGSGPYPANKTCVWVIEGPVGSQIQIQVLDDLNMKMHLVLNGKQWQIQDMLKRGGGGSRGRIEVCSGGPGGKTP